MRSQLIGRSLWLIGVAGLLIANAGSAEATVVTATPEISPGSVSAGLAALAGGVLILRALRRR